MLCAHDDISYASCQLCIIGSVQFHFIGIIKCIKCVLHSATSYKNHHWILHFTPNV